MTKIPVSRLIPLILLGLAALACNAPFMQSGSAATPVVSPAAVADNGARPTVVIEEPANGSQAVILKPVTFRVHATDSTGITRVEMHESGRMVSSQLSPEPDPDFTALLSYNPTSVGTVTLEIVAYRQTVASDPVTISIEVVARESDLRAPLNATTSWTSGSDMCTVRVNISNLNLRAGPGTNYRILSTLQVGEEMAVLGRNADTSWYQIKRKDNSTGWVSAGYVSAQGAYCSQAPVTTPAP